MAATEAVAALAPEPGNEPEPGRAFPVAVRAFARSRQARTGIGVVVAIAAFCFIGPLFYHTNQVTVNLGSATQPPGNGQPLGTDASGYDVLGRLMLGGQSSLELGLAVTVVTTIIGTLYGVIAGLTGGFVDAIMMRVVDTFLAVPAFVLLLVLVNMFAPTLWIIIVLLALLSWIGVARLVRGEVLALNGREFVQAARMMGSSRRRMIFRHLIPNAVGVIVVNATFTVSDAILMLSALSFLGLGLPPPEADWGTMLSDGLNYLFDGYWWMVYPPAIILIITVIGINLIGDALRESLDVRLQRR